MTDTPLNYKEMDREEKVRLMMNMLMRIVMHFGFWFTETRHQMGMDEALELCGRATDRTLGIGLKRFSKVLGFEMENGLPKVLLDMAPESMDELLVALAKNWLVADGVWFQAIESAHGMNDAKRCNDSCWAQYSPYEAHAIKSLLGLGDRPGLSGLKRALNFRMYSLINKQSIVDETPESFVFQMNECRVQVARKRKNMPDYPCKSVGLVEYTYFARAIDDRIRTRCIGCPPDDHPDEWYCAWQFSIDGGESN